MIEEFELKILGNIGEINVSSDKIKSKVETRKSSETEYELYIAQKETNRIVVCKFTLNEEFFCKHEETFDDGNSKALLPFQVNLWKTFHLPFCICDFALSDNGFWIIGEEFYSNIKPYIVGVMEIDSPKAGNSIEDHCMEVDNDNFILQEYEFTVKLPTALKHNITNEKFYLKSDSFEESIIIGSRNTDRKVWQFDLVTSKYEPLLETELSDIIQLAGVNMTYKKTYQSYEDQSKLFAKPFIVLYKNKELEKVSALRNNVLHMLLSINSSRVSNCVGIIGHPEGKVFYFLGSQQDDVKYFTRGTQVEEMYDMKQPVAGIHIVKDIGGIKGTCLLMVGIFGKVVYLSGKLVTSKQKSTEIVLSESVTLYATTFELPSCVQHHVLFKGNIFFLSPEGKLCLFELSKIIGKMTDGKESLVLSKNSVLMQRVADFLLLNESTGLFLLITNTGCLYLSECIVKKNDTEISVSLPSLMNEAMQLSTELQKISLIKSFQTMFFKAVSTLATFKFRGFSELNVKCTYSLTDTKNPSKIFLLLIDIQGLDEFQMKSDCWYITASIYSCLQRKSPVITKTVPFNPESTNISLEVEESLLSAGHSWSLPLLVELGLILTLPERMRSLNCFKLIKDELPLYVKVKELLLNELCLMEIQPNRLKKIHSLNPLRNGENLLSDVIALCKSRTFLKLLKSSYKIPNLLTSANFMTNVQFCMLQSTADSLLKLDFTDAVLPFRVLRTILQKTLSEKTAAVLNVKCRDKMASINVSAINNCVTFTVDTDAFDLLAKIRMAMTSTLLMLQWVTGDLDARSFSMSANLNRDCEELSKELLTMYGQDVEADDFMEKVLLKYQALRKMSSRLIFC